MKRTVSQVTSGWTVLWVLVALGCGSPPPQIGNFKRSPDPEPNVTPVPNDARTAAPRTAAPEIQLSAQAASVTGGAAANASGATAVVEASALLDTANISVEPVDTSWPPERKLEQTVARLKKIALAVRAYAAKNGRCPVAPGQRHSWRVMLLPYLGHSDQFSRFNLQEPWDSPANQAAANETPVVYQSPWRNDDLTCFQAPLAVNTVLASPAGLDVSRLADKWSAVIELLMVDNESAMPWSKPVDFAVSRDELSKRMIGRDSGGFLVALADGDVRWVPASIEPSALMSLMTIGGDEYASIAVHTKDAAKALPRLTIAAASTATAASTNGGPSLNSATFEPTADSVLAPNASDDNRIPVPDDEAIAQAKSKLQQVLQAAAQTIRKDESLARKRELAKALISNAPQGTEQVAEHFVMLHAARDYAAETGDFQLARQATNSLIERYRVNEVELRKQTIMEVEKSQFGQHPQQVDQLRQEAEQVLKTALRRDDFAAAKELLKSLVRLTRRSKSDRKGNANALRQQMQGLEALEQQIGEMQTAYADAENAARTLRDAPEDAAAHGMLGSYLCFVKLNWQEGANHLTRGSNLRLKILAAEDLARPVGPQGMVDLANEYWTLSEREAGFFKRGLQLRAVYWYREAFPQLASSLAKLQAEHRSAAANVMYGEGFVEEALSLMDNSPGLEHP